MKLPTSLNPLALAERLTGRPMAEGTRHFFKDSFFYSFANLLPRMLGFLMLPIVTRRLDSPGDLNIFYIYNNAIAVLCVIMSAQAELAVARYYYEEKPDFPDYLGTQFFFTLGLSAIMGVQFLIFRQTWAWVFQLPVFIFVWCVITTIGQIYHTIAFQLMLARKQSRAFFNYNMAKNLIYVAIGITLLFTMARDRYVGLVYAHAIATLSLAGIFFVQIVRQMRPAFRWAHLRYALRLTVPGIPGAVSLFMLNFFDRIFLQHKNPDVAGQYAFAYQIGMLIQMVTSGIFSAYMPRFYAERNREQYGAIQTLHRRNLLLLLLAAAGLVLLSKPVAVILGKPAYFGALPAVPIVVTGYLFMYLGQVQGLYIAYHRRFVTLQSISMILAAVINVGFNVALIPRFLGDPYTLARVVALNTLVAYLVQWLIVYGVSRWLLKERIVTFKGSLLAFLAYLAFATVWSFIGY